MYDARYKQMLWKREKLAGMSLKRAHQSAVVFWQFVVVAWNQRANNCPNWPNWPKWLKKPNHEPKPVILLLKHLLFIKLSSCHFIYWSMHVLLICIKLSSCHAIFQLTDVTQSSLTSIRGPSPPEDRYSPDFSCTACPGMLRAWN